MDAKEMFENLGYIQKIYYQKGTTILDGIQYIKKDPETELERVGMLRTKLIEFYPSSKEILMSSSFQNRNGITKSSDVVVLSFEEFRAVELQVIELGWK